MDKSNVSFGQKVIYGLPEGIAQLLMVAVGVYSMSFYTDHMFMNAAVIGAIFLAARVVSILTDPMVGTFLDTRKPLKNGRFTPYMIGGCLVMGLSSVLLFLNLDISMGGKIFYVVLTYFLYNIAYSFFQVPYGSVLTTLTSDYSEANRIGSIRSFIGAIGIALGSYCVEGLHKVFGGFTGTVNNFTLTTLVMGLALIVSGFMVKRFVPERVAPAPKKQTQEKVKIQDILKIAVANKPLIIVVLVNFLTNLAWTLRNASALYFFRESVGRPGLLPLYLAIAGLSQLPVIAVLPRLTAKFGNRRVIVTATLISWAGFAALGLGKQNNIVFLLVSATISGIGWSVFYGLMFGMVANTIEYGEWKNGVRAAGISTSLPLLAFKLAMGLSGFLLGILLQMGGYIPGVTQSVQAIQAINAAFIYIPAGLAVLWLITIMFYDLDEKYPEIIEDLEIRRQGRS